MDTLAQCVGLAKGIINNRPLLGMVFVGSVVVGTSGTAATETLKRLSVGTGIIDAKKQNTLDESHFSPHHGL